MNRYVDAPRRTRASSKAMPRAMISVAGMDSSANRKVLEMAVTAVTWRGSLR